MISCEHGGNRVPAEYRAAFVGAKRALASHRGYDPGALELAREFARELRAPLFASTTSRLLVELNRSLHHRQLFSPYAQQLARETRDELVQRYYLPYRHAIERHIARAVRRGRRVIHLSCHSFTPRLGGVVRSADIGLLFDPRRQGEALLCGQWQAELRSRDPRLRVRRNYPYRGWADGFTTSLRQRFADSTYLGIELEVNQRFPLGRSSPWRSVRRELVASLKATLRAL